MFTDDFIEKKEAAEKIAKEKILEFISEKKFVQALIFLYEDHDKGLDRVLDIEFIHLFADKILYESIKELGGDEGKKIAEKFLGLKQDVGFWYS